MNNIEEETLVARMKSGDKNAFAKIYNEYKASVYRTACLISGNSHDGEDIMQETFIKAFTHCRELKSDGMFKYWLFKILNRTAWQMLKSKKSEIPEEDILDRADKNTDCLVEDTLLLKERSARIYNAVMQLDYKHRLVIILYYYNEMSTKQIARIADCHEGTVKSRLYTARKHLKRLIPETDEIK